MGVIKKGAVSDLVLLNGNPLTNIEHVKNIEGVMLGTHWLSKDQISKELKRLEKSWDHVLLLQALLLADKV